MARTVILNADDFGYEPNVTRGIAEAMREGLVSSTTMMVNGPYAEDAAAQAEGLSIGLHFNLARWRALSDGRALEERAVPGLSEAFVEGEAEAQLAKLAALLGRPATHVDVHKHLHHHPNVLAGLAAAARRHGLRVRSIDVGMRQTLRRLGVETNDAFVGDAGDEAYWTHARFVEALEALPGSGVVELMCHPGYAPTAFASGYSAQREVELATFTSAPAKAAARARGVRFAAWPRHQ